MKKILQWGWIFPLVLYIGILPAISQDNWMYQPEMDISFPLADSLVFPYLCTVDVNGNLWVISSSAASPGAKNALFKAAPGDTQMTLVVDYTGDLNIESTRGITAIGDTIFVVSRVPGNPWPSTSIMYEYKNGDPDQRQSHNPPGFGTWVLGLSATKDKYIYAGISYLTSIRVYDFTDTSSARGWWVPIEPVSAHPQEPGGHDGTGQSIIRDVATIPGADYNDPGTPWFSSRNSDSSNTGGGIAVWTGGTQTSPIDYQGQRVSDVASDLAWRYWTPYGITCDSEGNLYASGTDSTRRWVKVFSVSGNFAVELEELPSATSQSDPDPSGAPLEAPSDVALSPDEKIAYVIDQDAKKVFVFNRGPVSIQPPSASLLKGYRLEINYPNPFNPTTYIQYHLPNAARVQLRVFNLLGKEVATLVDGRQPAGTHEVQFNGANLPSGVYFYRLEANDFTAVRKMVLMR